MVPVRSRAARVPVAPPAAPGAAARGRLRWTSSATRRAARRPPRRCSTTSGWRRWRRSWTARCASSPPAISATATRWRSCPRCSARRPRRRSRRRATRRRWPRREKALAAETATRGASEALASDGDDDAGARARAALGAAAADSPKETARALAAAARGVGERAGAPRRRRHRTATPTSSGGCPGEGDPAGKPDDASRDRRGAPTSAAWNGCSAISTTPPRRAATAIRTAARRPRGAAKIWAKLAGRGASAESLRRLERALRQMRERLGRGEMRDGEQSAMRGFERAARGESGTAGPGPGTARTAKSGRRPAAGRRRRDKAARAAAWARETPWRKAKGEGEGRRKREDGKGGDRQGNGLDGRRRGRGHATGEAAALLARARDRASSSSGGDGAGSQARRQARSASAATCRRAAAQTEARVANGAGPNRAEVIGGAADRGFAQRGYARVFSDYQAAVEDALATTAVPEGRRYVVRRYFDSDPAARRATRKGRQVTAPDRVPSSDVAAAAVAAFRADVDRLLVEIARRMVGQADIAGAVAAALLAGGHVLLEGVPGLGKTLLVRTLAEALELSFSRIQFTPDLMPADILGHQPDRRERPAGRAVAPLRVPARADLRAHRARRRDQPRHAQDAVGAARGDAGAVGHRRQADLPAAAAVLRAGDAEPDRDGGHLPAARGAARSLLVQAARRAARPRRPARHPRPHDGQRGAGGAAGARARAPARDARAGAPGAGRASRAGLRRPPGRGDAPDRGRRWRR